MGVKVPFNMSFFVVVVRYSGPEAGEKNNVQTGSLFSAASVLIAGLWKSPNSPAIECWHEE